MSNAEKDARTVQWYSSAGIGPSLHPDPLRDGTSTARSHLTFDRSAMLSSYPYRCMMNHGQMVQDGKAVNAIGHEA
jgi:hypothetical protein